MNKLDLLKPLIRAIDNCNLYDDFSLSQRVTYQYYVGRKALLDSDYALGMLFYSNRSYVSFFTGSVKYDNVGDVILNNKIKLNVNYHLLS